LQDVEVDVVVDCVCKVEVEEVEVAVVLPCVGK
jgi:hypothetical protein